MILRSLFCEVKKLDKMLLSKKELPKFISEIKRKYTVYAPVRDDDIVFYRKIENPSEIELDFSNSNYPPKSLFLKQTETLFKFKPGPNADIKPAEIGNEKSVVFAIRPCDAKSLSILDHVFKQDYKDPFYLDRRKNSILIGLSCNEPTLNCFCSSFDDTPASSKYVDVLLTDIGDSYFVEVSSDKGKQLIKDFNKHFKPVKKEDEKKRDDVEKKAIAKIKRHVKTENIVEKLDKIFENPFWKEYGFKCVGCGTCTYLCPTCHCFDIQDESTLTKGARIRVWDTCMNPEYTLHASGYNPRPARTNRVRNRINHKYNYYPKNFDIIACVGCGRCIKLCPVNIDIIDVVNKAGEVKI
jgi:heterodisulfide reductase subunit C